MVGEGRGWEEGARGGSEREGVGGGSEKEGVGGGSERVGMGGGSEREGVGGGSEKEGVGGGSERVGMGGGSEREGVEGGSEREGARGREREGGSEREGVGGGSENEGGRREGRGWGRGWGREGGGCNWTPLNCSLAGGPSSICCSKPIKFHGTMCACDPAEVPYMLHAVMILVVWVTIQFPVLLAMASPSYGTFEIFYDEVLGSGSYGMVCKAECGQLPCAAKLLHAPSTNIDKFHQECQVLSTIQHPNIVQYLGTVTDPQSKKPALLMELMDESLTEFLERSSGPLPYDLQLNTCHDIALALSYLHSNGIIHRDLSSNNILLIGEGSRAKVSDFGMSKLIPRQTSAPMTQQLFGTPMTQYPGTIVYMPPEAGTDYTAKLDCFSFGVLTIQILTRNFPQPYSTHTTLFGQVKIVSSDIGLIHPPSHPLRPVALDCLKYEDTERPSADVLCERLASLKGEPSYTEIRRLRGELKRIKAELNKAEQLKPRSHEDFNSLPVAYFQSRFKSTSESTSRGWLNSDYATGSELKSSCERGLS